MTPSAEECAGDLMDAVPMVMRFIRTEMRGHRDASLSVPQFRTLVFINRNPDTSLGDVANHLGLTPPTTSVLVDNLVMRGFVEKQPSHQDRRRIKLELREMGRQNLESAQRATHDQLAEKIKFTTSAERETISQAMHILKKIYSMEKESS